MELSYKAIGFLLEEVKARGEDGWSFSGYASTFDNVDEGGDVVLPGAFRGSLARRTPRLLWQHDISEPIGKVLALDEDDHGLHGDFLLSRTTRGHDAYQLLKDGAIDAMSIGYIPEEKSLSPDGVRQLKSVDLFEVSLVSLPMNQEARVTAVKAVSISSPTSGPSIASLRLAIARRKLERLHLLESAR